jgi:hypothetical protein
VDKLITTAMVAKELGLKINSLTSLLTRFPHLRPQTKVGSNYVWTQEEVDRLIAHRASGKKGKPRVKNT